MGGGEDKNIILRALDRNQLLFDYLNLDSV